MDKLSCLKYSPKRGHPTVKVVGVKTFDVECRIIRVNMDVLVASCSRDRGVWESDLVSRGFTRFEGVGEETGLVKNEVPSRKACPLMTRSSNGEWIGGRV